MKQRKRKLLSALLSALLLFTALPFAVSAEGTVPGGAGGYAVGDVITFGGYPQSRVTDETTLAALDAAEKHWASYHYRCGAGDIYPEEIRAGDWMRYADVTVNGQKYRAVMFDSYRPENVSDSPDASYFRQAENGYESGTVYYFRYEPLCWRVLDPEAGLVLCENAIDAQAYRNSYSFDVDDEGFVTIWQTAAKEIYGNDYAGSDLRQWLAKDFYYTAFSAEERAAIGETVLDNNAANTDDVYAPTTDRLFLLSVGDLQNEAYGFRPDNRDTPDPAKRAEGTDYAMCQGLYYVEDQCYTWWLRSPLNFPEYTGVAFAAVLCGVLTPYEENFDGMPVIMTSAGVRPAFRFADGIRADDNPNGGDHTSTNHIAGEPAETVLQAATCGANGQKLTTVICEVCGKTISEETAAIPATGEHVTELRGRIEATATENGYTGDLVCTVCGRVIEEGEVIPAAGENTTADPDLPERPTPTPHGKYCFCRNFDETTPAGSLLHFLCGIYCSLINVFVRMGVL